MIALSLGILLAPKYQTWFFVNSDCPIARRFTPEMRRIMKDFAQTADFRFVYEDEGARLSVIKAHHREYQLECPFLLDPSHKFAKQFKVKTVPTVVIMSTSDQVFYHGRIDDSYGNDFKWHEPKKRDLRNALGALKLGKAVPIKVTPVVGCALNP